MRRAPIRARRRRRNAARPRSAPHVWGAYEDEAACGLEPMLREQRRLGGKVAIAQPAQPYPDMDQPWPAQTRPAVWEGREVHRADALQFRPARHICQALALQRALVARRASEGQGDARLSPQVDGLARTVQGVED